MTKPKRIAFFAPIKPPDHPIPSGDRLIAQNLLKVFESGGHNVELASRYICYSKRNNPEILENRKSGALAEANRIVSDFKSRSDAQQPDVWITYHPYCKAPDWIGPVVSRKFDIPYITIEAARTGQEGWDVWRDEAQTGLKQADLHLVFKPSDKTYLAQLLGNDSRLFEFPTFMNTEISCNDPHPLPSEWNPDTPVLITTGMMRKGKKDKNFYMLAEILAGVTDKDWNLIIVGGGPEEENIRRAFKQIPGEQIHWTGQVGHDEVLSWMKAADLFIWPGWKEPIGMVYLEAQLQGLPVIAYESMGVPLVVEHGKTGLLAPEGNLGAIRENLSKLILDKTLRMQMGGSAKTKVTEEHSIGAAAKRLNQLLNSL